MLKTFQRLNQRFHVHRRRHARNLKRASRHPFAVPVIALAVMAVLAGGYYLVFTRNQNNTINPNIVIISHDHIKQVVSSKEPDVGTLLDKLGIKIGEGDIVEPALTTKIQQDDFRINIYRASPLVVIDDGQKTFTYSAATTSRTVAQQAGIKIYPEDNLKITPVTDFVATGSITSEVTVDRATPVDATLYGSKVTLRTHAKTVRDLLAEKNVKLTSQDVVKPSLDAPIAANEQISVVRNGLSTLTAQEDIPMPVQNVSDGSLAYGTSAVRQTGAPGKRYVTYQVNTQNGIEVGRTVIQSVVTQQPVTQIVALGANLSGIKGDMALAGIAPGDYQYADYIISHESGWCPTKWQGEYGGCQAYHGTPSSAGTGYGLCQATPGYKMASAGDDWATNPVTQLRWCSGYAHSRFGSWAAAYNYWVAHHNW